MDDNLSDTANPYQKPDANVVEEPSAKLGAEDLRSQPVRAKSGAGRRWFRQGFLLYRGEWPVWSGVFLIWLCITVAVSNVPLVSLLSPLVMTVLAAGIMYAARDSQQHKPLRISLLLIGFKERVGPLLAVGGIYLAGMLLCWLLAAVVMFLLLGLDNLMLLLNSDNPADPAMLPRVVIAFSVAALVVLTGVFLLVMMSWFAPAIVIFHPVSGWQAMKLSFRGCLKNVVPLTFYSFIVIAWILLALLPLVVPAAVYAADASTSMVVVASVLGASLSGVMWFALIPTLWLTIYLQYQDIFVEEPFEE